MANKISTTDVATLRRQYRTQKTWRSNVERAWDEIEYYTGAMSEEGHIASQETNTDGSAGVQRKSDVWDHTAIDGREKLSASMHGSVVPPSLRWFLLAYRVSQLNRDSESKSWLDEESENCWNDLQDSDFNTEIGCNFHELTGPGHTFVAIEPIVGDVDPKTLKEEWAGADFTALPFRECYFMPDRRGEVLRFWSKLMW